VAFAGAITVLCSPSCGAELLSVDTSDPAITEFKQRGRESLSSLAPIELLKSLEGLKIPVLDFTKQPEFFTTKFKVLKQSKLTFSADDKEKVWYSITREYKQPGVLLTISGDLRVQGRIGSEAKAAPARVEILAAGVKGNKDEDFIAAQINLYRYPNIPYVIDVECNSEYRFICADKAILATLPESLGLIAVPQ
jgi:hypothetical protein